MKFNSLIILLLTLLLSNCLSQENSQDKNWTTESQNTHILVKEARKYLGIPYKWGGRSRNGLDCMGLCFLSYAEAYNKNWRILSVNPTELIENQQLGKKVDELFGVSVDSIDCDLLKSGDIVYLLYPCNNPNETEIFIDKRGIKYWVWHMGIYSGGEKHNWINADFFSEKVIETPLKEYMLEYGFERIVVSRIDGF